MFRFLPAACVLLLAGAAHANCTTATTLGFKDAAGTTLAAAAEPDSNTNCVPNTYITDGAGAQNRVAVKAASTAAVAADPALVVRFSPDNTSGIVDAAGVNKATVKAASTPATATDPALVVSVSPNNAVGLVDSAGTNKATVKAASTAPSATDTALVVALSPNGQGCAGVSIANTHWQSVSITTATNTQIITGGAAGTQTYICSVIVWSAIANNVAIVEGTGTTCGTGTAGMSGGITAANGWPIPANGGQTIGDGRGPIMRTNTAQDNVCLFPSSVGPLSMTIVWAQQ